MEEIENGVVVGDEEGEVKEAVNEEAGVVGVGIGEAELGEASNRALHLMGVDRRRIYGTGIRKIEHAKEQSSGGPVAGEVNKGGLSKRNLQWGSYGSDRGIEAGNGRRER
jgi:hypothetical protein